MNELVTTGPTTSRSIALVTREDCIRAAQNALRDYKATMLQVIEHWCKPVKDGGLGLPIEELAAELDKAPRTLKEYRTELYKQGRLEKSPSAGGRPVGYRPVSGNPHTSQQLAPDQAPTPETTTHLSQAVPTAREGELMAIPRELGPGEYTHPDYNKIIQLFEQIDNLIHANIFRDDFSSDEWISIHGSWQCLGVGIRAKCDHIKGFESNRDEAITVDYSEAP